MIQAFIALPACPVLWVQANAHLLRIFFGIFAPHCNLAPSLICEPYGPCVFIPVCPAYLQMLQRMVQGLAVEPTQLAPYKEPTPPLVPADLLAGAAATGQRQGEQQLQRRASQVGSEDLLGWTCLAGWAQPAALLALLLALQSSTDSRPGCALLLPWPSAGCAGDQGLHC